MIQVSLPLSVVTYRPKTPKGKLKKFILNLNNYRNAYQFTLATAKREYHKLIAPLFDGGSTFDKAFLIYVYHHGNQRRIDTMNTCSIINKFTEDTITELGLWEDDDSKHVVGHMILPGTVSKEDPRCNLTIMPWKDVNDIIMKFLQTASIESSELEIIG